MYHKLDLGAWRKVFAVPSCVAEDNHLKLASGAQLKVLLYMLANPDMGITSENISAATGVEVHDVEDALLYWVNAGVLANEGSEYRPPEKTPAGKSSAESVSAAAEQRDNPLSTPEARAALSKETHFPPKTIAGAVNGSDAVKYLFTTYEKLAGRPPRHAEQQTLMVLVEEIGLPCEVTMMLVEYCFKIDKATPAYMKAVARDWCDNGISDIPKAEARIKLLYSRHSAENRLREKFGIAGAFSAKQKQMIAEWTDLDIPEQLIDEAYDRMITNTGKLSLPYMDKILRKWMSEGIRESSQIPKKPPRPDGGQDAAPSYNINEIEQQSFDLYKDL